MKKALVYILSLVLLLGCLAACNRAGEPVATATPHATIQPTKDPQEVLPNPEDGMVNDDDGIITGGDNGAIATPKPTASAGTVSASPSASADSDTQKTK